MLEVKPTANHEDIKAVLSDPVIWDAITVDGNPSPEEMDWRLYDDWLSVGGYVDGKPIAIMMFHSYGDGDKAHIHVLPDYRKEYASKFYDEAMKYAQYPVYADIPDIYPNVQKFVEAKGAEKLLNFRASTTKNGHEYTVTRYVRY